MDSATLAGGTSLAAWRAVRSLLVVLALAFAAHPAVAQPCDPVSGDEPAPVPLALRLTTTCGNGKIDTYASSCVDHVTGGCGLPMSHSLSCQKGPETCDGNALGGQTCSTLGYARGTLRCTATCARFALEGCSLCPAPATCRETTFTGPEFVDITLLAQGPRIRAFWSNDEHYFVADVDAKGGFSTPRRLDDVGALRVIPVLVGSSAMTIVGDAERPQLSIVEQSGRAKQVALPGQNGDVFMPIVPIERQPLALVITGQFYVAHVQLMDARGVARPLVPTYGHNTYRRVALVAIAPGKHRVRFGNVEGDLTAERGDLLLVSYDTTTLVEIVRRGAVTSTWIGESRTLPDASPVVVVDGATVVAFGELEDVVAGVKHARSQAPPPTHLFGDHAYDSEVAIARTSQMEIQAARVALDEPDDKRDPAKDRGVLVVGVRALAK